MVSADANPIGLTPIQILVIGIRIYQEFLREDQKFTCFLKDAKFRHDDESALNDKHVATIYFLWDILDQIEELERMKS